MSDLVVALGIVGVYVGIGVVHYPLFRWLSGVVWDHERKKAKRDLRGWRGMVDENHDEYPGFAHYLSEQYDIDDPNCPAKFAHESSLFQAAGWPIADAFWLMHWIVNANERMP